MKSRSALSLRVLGAAVATAVTGSLLVGVPAAQTASAAGLPTNCSVGASAYSPGGARLTYAVRGGSTIRSVERGNGLGWRPTALANWGGAGDATSFMSNDWAARGTGVLYDVYRTGTEGSDGVWTVRTTPRVVARSGWGSTRGITVAYDSDGLSRVYRLTSQGLYRYPIKGNGNLGVRLTVQSSGWSGVRNLIYERSEGIGDNRVDVFLANIKGGALREYRVLQRRAAFSYRTLRTKGFSFTTIATGWCNNSSARPILGINTSLGRAAVFLDRNPRDSSGSDITGGWTSARNWTNKAYGQ